MDGTTGMGEWVHPLIKRAQPSPGNAVFNSLNSGDACIFLRNVSESDEQKNIYATSGQDGSKRTFPGQVIHRNSGNEGLGTPWGWASQRREQHHYSVEHVWLYGPRTSH